MYSKISVIVSVILVTAAIQTVQSSMLQPSYAQPNQDLQAVLNLHNQERRAVGVPDLTWSNSLATDAQNWARYITSLNLRPVTNTDPGQLAPHSDWRTNGNQGENLAWGTRGGYTPATLAQGWANEKSNCFPGCPIPADGSLSQFPMPPCERDCRVYGHYTQMVWRSTTQIGCGWASDANQDYLVCRYSPSGNYAGQPAY
jgi:Cysteine-rich secretory protein family